MAIIKTKIKKISECQIGEYIASFNISKNEKEYRRIEMLHEPIVQHENQIKIIFDNGDSYTTSTWHPTLIYIKGKLDYIRADLIKVGDKTITANGEIATVIEIDTNPKADVNYFDLTVEGNNNYFCSTDGKEYHVVHNTRKGACAVNMEPWHIDILDFIELKKNSGEERRRTHELFPTVWISDLFMQRILNDELWTLFDPYDVPLLEGLYGEAFEAQYVKYEADKSIKNTITMKAKDLWKKVLTNYFESGNPFLAFKDTANKANPNNHSGVIYSTNLCTEIFQSTSANQYLMKAYIEDGINNDKFVSFKESAKVLLDNGIIKEGKKVTSLDSIVSIDGIEFPKGPYKVYCVEKEKINGKTAVCNLASVNLGKINTKSDIERVIPIAVNMLDNVIDLNYYPLKKVKDTNMESRSIGLGVMGEAEMLATKGIHFGSIEHLNIIDNVMEMISFNTIKSSSKLGLERGSYPNFENSKWNNGILPIDIANTEAIELTNTNNKIYSEEEYAELRTMVSKSMRNGYLMAIAPTSSISILVGTTQCIEPVYKRKWYEENLSGLIPVVVPKLSPDTYEFYTSAYDVEQFDIIRAAAVRQKWIDQGQSTNIFMRLDKSSGKYLHEIYTLAWKLGLKSTYYLRSQSPESAAATMDVADRSMECVGCQ